MGWSQGRKIPPGCRRSYNGLSGFALTREMWRKAACAFTDEQLLELLDWNLQRRREARPGSEKYHYAILALEGIENERRRRGRARPQKAL